MFKFSKMMSKFLKRKKIIFTFFLILSSFSLTAVISTNFHLEPSYVRDNTSYFFKYGSEIGLSEKSKHHREFSGGYAGDAIHYIMNAMDKEHLSHTPYTYRVLIPKIAGAIAKQFVNKKETNNYEDKLFKMISFIWRGINIVSCFLLMLIPIIHFRKFIFEKKIPFEFPLILLMNVFNMGVIMTAPFSLVDIPTYVIITLGASFFFNNNIKLLTLIICLGVFIKEITIILMLPLLYLIWFKEKKNLIIDGLILIAPIALFLIFRIFISGDATDMGQLGYSFKDPLNFHYLDYHLNKSGIEKFFARIFFSIGIIFIIFLHYRLWYKKLHKEFFMILVLTISVIILNLLLASAVIRVIQVVAPFLIFYILESIRLKNLKI